jgi:hypothetical protein
MAWNSLNNKDNGHSVGLAYLSDIVVVGGIQSVVPGTGIGVDNTNILNPVVSNTGVLSVKAFGEAELTGDIELKAGSNITLTQTDQTITIASTTPPEAGVVSLQGLTGALTFSSSDDSININQEVGGTVIDLTSNGVPPVGGVSSLSDGTTALTGAITLIGEGCSITASTDPSPAITISVVPVETGVSAITINGGSASLTGVVDFAQGTGIAITAGAGAYGIANDGVLSVSDGANALTGAVSLIAGEGIEFITNTEAKSITISSDPFVGIYYLTTAQNLTAVGTPWINNVVNLTPDPQSDVAVISYDAPTGTWTVIKEGVYFLNFSAGIIQNDATWTLGSFCQCFIVITSGATQLNFCNSLTPSQTSGVSTFNGQVFGYIPLSVGTTITCGFQWYLTAVGATPAQFQPRTNGVNNGTNFNWVYVRPFL